MRTLIAIVAGLGLMVAAIAGIALALVLGVVAAGAVFAGRLTGRLQPAMARSATAKPDHRASQNQFRVWDDGRGTIIDM
ncbi:hypothetical protein OEG84_15215 [Hoeflea sp. G2-23]|uniref:Molecular chaperone DnaJ n=1 Tax=Hoeflea algicola TaxID=2983763 RepID=A0ABT3ZB52_9HYPH|nr:hypothetical protein [Hoeflea algicola]MCY0149017.1 hypothetical protein [Hoeflea algicola]